MQNLLVLMEPFEDAHVTPLKAGNMILNRFCIDEDAAFELSGVNYLKKSSWEMMMGRELTTERKVKGKNFSFVRSETILLLFTNFIYLNN